MSGINKLIWKFMVAEKLVYKHQQAAKPDNCFKSGFSGKKFHSQPSLRSKKFLMLKDQISQADKHCNFHLSQ